MRVAANLSMMFADEGGLLSRYKAAASAGFKFVECAFPYEESEEAVAEALQSNGLTQVLINAPPGDKDKGYGFGLACIPKAREEFAESMKTAIKYAKALRCSRIHVMAGKSPSDDLAVNVERCYTDNLRLACEMTVNEGITCLIEPINGYSIPGYYLNSYQQAIGQLELSSDVNLKLQLDLFHCQLIRGQLTNAIETLLPYTGHIQVAQAPHRRDPAAPGEIDYKYVFDYLKSEGYDGFIGAEYVPHKPTTQTLAWIDEFGLSKD